MNNEESRECVLVNPVTSEGCDCEHVAGSGRCSGPEADVMDKEGIFLRVCHGVCFLQSERAGVLEWRMGQVQRYVSEVQAKVS